MKLSISRESFRKSLDIEDFVYESRMIIQDYQCPLCDGIYLNPVVDACGHVYCKACILKHLENSKTCPSSGSRLEETSLTVLVIVNNILEKQMVQCKNRIYHCSWVGKLMDLESHLTTDCFRQLVRCSHEGCLAEVFREDLEGHQGVCDYRIISCADCFIQVPFINIRPHQDVCPKFKILCPQNCGNLIERQDGQTHILDYCQNTIINCPYEQYDCTTKIAKRDLEEYLTKSVNHHNFLVLKWLRSYQNFLSTKTINMEVALNSFDEKLKKFELQTLTTTSSAKDKDKENTHRELKETNLNTEADIRKKNKKNSEAITLPVNLGHSNCQMGEKYLTKKRQRLEEDNNIGVKIKDKIDLDSLEEEEVITISENILGKNLNETIVIVPKIENTFDQLNLSKGIQILNSKAVCLGNNKSEHRFVFANYILNRNSEWKVTIGPNNPIWLAVGVCNKEQVIFNKFRFVGTTQNFNHSFFGISTNGYLWNANNSTENNNYLSGFPHVIKGESICFRYLVEERELYYKFTENKYTGKITDVYSPKNGSLCPCIVFLNSGDEVNLEFL